MDYAIHTLKHERSILEQCLKGCDPEKHQESFKLRKKRLKELNDAIELCTSTTTRQ